MSKGFAAGPAGFVPEPARVTVDANGRILVPVALRKAVGITPGDAIIVDVVDGGLRIETYDRKLRRAQDIARKYKGPGASVVDEFLAERRKM